MTLYSIPALGANSAFSAIESQLAEDEGRSPFGSGLPADEVADAFGYDADPTDEQMDRDYAAAVESLLSRSVAFERVIAALPEPAKRSVRRYASADPDAAYDAAAAGELLAKYPGLRNLPDEALAGIVEDPAVELMGDADEARAAAALILAGRLAVAAA